MQISEAKHFIQTALISPIRPMRWADLGCGSGIFTQALATLLPAKSTIFAVDQSPQYIFQPTDSLVKIEFVQANFEQDDWYLEEKLEGVMMANALHYVADKIGFLKRLLRHCSKDVLFIVVEYDHMNANTWVPYPIDFQNIEKLFQKMGFGDVVKLGERKSIYGGGNMYACSIKR